MPESNEMYGLLTGAELCTTFKVSDAQFERHQVVLTMSACLNEELLPCDLCE